MILYGMSPYTGIIPYFLGKSTVFSMQFRKKQSGIYEALRVNYKKSPKHLEKACFFKYRRL